MIIAHLAFDDLATGRFHTFRGMLSMMGGGKLVVWNAAMKGLLQMGACTEEQFREEQTALNQIIRSCG